MRYKIFPLLFTVVLLSLFACHSGKEAASSTSPLSEAPLSSDRLEAKFSELKAGYGEWTTFKVPVSLRMTSPKDVGMSGVLTMKRNSYINLSLRFLGMEVAAVTLTNDSVYAVYKMGRLYLAESIDNFAKGFPVTVGNIQEMLIGHAFVPGRSVLSSSNCILEGNETVWTLSPTTLPSGYNCIFDVATPVNSVEALRIMAPNRRPVTARYSDIDKTVAGPMAGIAEISAETVRGPLAARITYNLNKAEWGKTISVTRPQTNGYTRIGVSDLMRIIANL